MRISLFILWCGFTYMTSAQQIRITNRETGAEIMVYPRKVKAVVTKGGEFFEGPVRPLPNYLIVGDNSVAYEEIGFLEVKKLNSKAFLSQPLKWIGGGLVLTGAGMAAFDVEDDDAGSNRLGIASLAVMGSGLVLFSLGKKKKNKNKKRTILHTRDWQFSYLPLPDENFKP